MKPFFIVLRACLFLPFAARATLGEILPPSARMAMKSVTAAAVSSRWRSVSVRQFADKRGLVFAVAWNGKNHPDLRELLGTHFDEFQRALAQAKRMRRGHAPVEIDSAGLHVELGGGPRAVFGRVWLRNNLPQGADPNELR